MAISTKAWNDALYFNLEDIDLEIVNLSKNDDYYTSEFCERIINKINSMKDEGYLNSFIAITLIYEDFQKEDSYIYFKGQLLD